MKRQSPLKALRVAQMRVDAAVTITITGKAGSGKSTAAEIITKALAKHGYNAKCIESDDDIYYSENILKRDNQDERLFLTIVEDSKFAYAAPEKEPATAEKCDGNCDECNGEKIPEGLDFLLKFMAMQAASQRM